MRSWAAAVVFLACATFARAQVAEFSLSGGVSRFGNADLGTSVDASGNIALTGKATASIYFGTGQSLGAGSHDSFIASITSSGLCR